MCLRCFFYVFEVLFYVFEVLFYVFEVLFYVFEVLFCSGAPGGTGPTVSLSISRTFMPGPLSSIILVTYCFTASITFIFSP